MILLLDFKSNMSSDKTEEKSNVERPIYTNTSNNREQESDEYESPDCCFVKTFCCCIRDVPVKVVKTGPK